MRNRTVVVALGGNAILRPGERGSYPEQSANIEAATAHIAAVVARGYRVVVTHGNGPQVGNILIQYAAAAGVVEPLPMFVAGAQTQGQLGFMIEQSLVNQLRRLGLDTPVVTVVTQVEVAAGDPAFGAPSKPVGPFYPAARARSLAGEHGWTMREDAGRGWRRVVPSPRPLRTVNAATIARLIGDRRVVIAAGGGGVPVVREPDGMLRGVDAVIDKDLAAARLAAELGADDLVILTAVPHVYLDFGTATQRALQRVTVDEMRALAAAGHFAAGSMGPKVEAALGFLRDGGRTATIARLDQFGEAVDGRAGTRIVATARTGRAAGSHGASGSGRTAGPDGTIGSAGLIASGGTAPSGGMAGSDGTIHAGGAGGAGGSRRAATRPRAVRVGGAARRGGRARTVQPKPKQIDQ